MARRDEWIQNILAYVPKNHLSYIFGKAVELPLPEVLAKMSVETFAKIYKINMQEAEHPISHYKTIEALFTRKLKEGARPIHSGLVHPCDSRITEAGVANEGVLIQAKGKTYTVEELIQDHEISREFEGGTYITYYLCPTDYHRVHSPVSGEVTQSLHIPGTLWPVNEWSVKRIPGLYTVNERVVTLVQGPLGPVAVVMVGATNVGKITVSYDSSLVSNDIRLGPALRTRRYKPSHHLNAGEELGAFHMGSTVVLLLNKNYKVDLNHARGSVLMGQKLGEI